MTKTQLKVSGERLIEDEYRRSLGRYIIYLMHLASYQFAESYCKNRRVLDLGCGTGYGAMRIAQIAASVHAVDVSDEAISYAKLHSTLDNVSFSVIQPNQCLPFPDSYFDVVLSFQVIEHVENDHLYLREAARILADDGVLILVTPDRKYRLLPLHRPWNRWHLREYSAASCRQRVEEHFEIVELLKMGASPLITQIELRRYRILKWLTLPFTLPILPAIWRRCWLNFIHHVKAILPGNSVPSDEEGKNYGFDADAIYFNPIVDKSLNLLILAHPRRPPN